MESRKGLLGGLAGVTLSSVLYGTILSARAGEHLVAGYTVAAGLAVFLLAFRAWTRGRRVLLTILGALLVAPLIYAGLPWSLALSLVEAVLLAVGIAGGGTLLIVFAGAGVGGFGGYSALAACGQPLLGFVPVLYHLVSISSATVRVTGDRSYALLTTIAGGLLLAVTLYIESAMAVPVALDLASRALERLPGPWAGLSLRAYGVMETFRIMIVLLALALLAPC